jgi:hypothetical protein
MGLSYYFAEAPYGPSHVLAWFRSLAEPPEETVTEKGVVLFFRQIGPLVLDNRGDPDGAQSPVVNVLLPQVRRSILWTTGAVHFLTSPMSRFPQIAKVHRDFKAWMTAHPLVYDPRRGAENPYSYYLVGAAANRGELYGLPSGTDALQRGQYFVDPLDNETVLNVIRGTLRLRGLECGPR